MNLHDKITVGRVMLYLILSKNTCLYIYHGRSDMLQIGKGLKDCTILERYNFFFINGSRQFLASIANVIKNEFYLTAHRPQRSTPF